MTRHPLNTVPAREVFDLAKCPAAYRKAFPPRENFAEPSPLQQPRLVMEADLEYEDEEKAFSLVRGMLIGIGLEVVAAIVIGGYVWARHIY